MGRPTLDEVLGAEDEWGLLDVAPLQAKTGGGELAEVTEDVRAFVAENGRPPDLNNGRPFAERLLATKAQRLAAEDKTLGALLQPVDVQTPDTLDDILDDELLDDDPIFTLKNVGARKPTEAPDYIGSRQPCADFERFRPLFEAAAADLQAARRVARPFAREQEIDAGQFFIVRGQMAYVAEASEPFRDKTGDSNRRLRVIYDNGTEGDPLLRSFAFPLQRRERETYLRSGSGSAVPAGARRCRRGDGLCLCGENVV